MLHDSGMLLVSAIGGYQFVVLSASALAADPVAGRKILGDFFTQVSKSGQKTIIAFEDAEALMERIPVESKKQRSLKDLFAFYAKKSSQTYSIAAHVGAKSAHLIDLVNTVEGSLVTQEDNTSDASASEQDLTAAK